MGDWSIFHWILLVCFIAISSSDTSGHQTAAGVPQLPSVEGSGSDDEDLSDLFSNVNSGDVTFRCYKCPGGSEQPGCNVTLLRQHPEAYWTECNGHCINITTGNFTIFDCTENVSASKARCFQRQAVKMCVCGTDFCNGPPPTRNDVMELPASHGIQLLSEHEVDVIPYETLRHRQNDDRYNTMQAGSSGGRSVTFCSRSLFLAILTLCWCHCIMLKNFSV